MYLPLPLPNGVSPIFVSNNGHLVSLIAIALVFPCQYLYQVLLVQPLWSHGVAKPVLPAHNALQEERKQFY